MAHATQVLAYSKGYAYPLLKFKIKKSKNKNQKKRKNQVYYLQL